MKKAKEYTNCFVDNLPIEVVNVLIKQAQSDAIEETVKLCAENAEIGYQSYFFKDGEKCLFKNDTYVNKKSILSVADKLKSEL